MLVTTHHLGEAEQCDRLVVLAAGRVVAAGSLAEIVGDATAAEVRTPIWEAAFTALDQAGLPVSLVGRTLRVPAADPAAVQRLLADAGVPAEVGERPGQLRGDVRGPGWRPVAELLLDGRRRRVGAVRPG